MIPWADNFSYQYYRTILQTINENFQVRLIAEAPQFLSQINGANQRQILLLRHDIDFDLESAERMAEVEHEMGISSCYMIMTTCPFYDIREHAAKLKQIQQLGHLIVHIFEKRNRKLKELFDTLVLLKDEIEGLPKSIKRMLEETK